MSKRCVVVAIVRPLEGHTDQVREQLEAVIPAVHQESGCEFYALHEGSDGTLIFVEAWDSRQQWVDHMEGPTVAEITARLEGLLAAPTEVHEVYGVPAGDTLRGVIPEGPR
jgi:quinol monooxygenase YgiN